MISFSLQKCNTAVGVSGLMKVNSQNLTNNEYLADLNGWCGDI